MPILGCIADDFTGGTDLASNLVKSGFRTVLTTGVPSHPLPDVDAIVVALKSRTAPVQEAVQDSLDALAYLQGAGCVRFYFKYCSTFDSTPEGNIGPVTDALLDALKEPYTVMCPAFPDNGRTVYQGHLFVWDRLLSESGMQNHPLTPMTDPDLVRFLQLQTVHKVGLLKHQVVQQGAAEVKKTLEDLHAKGKRLIVADALNNSDLKVLAEGTAHLKLVTGGSGLALGLTAPESSAAGQPFPRLMGRRLILAGSCSRATLEQLEHAKSLYPHLKLHPEQLAEHFDDVLQQALDWSLNRSEKLPVLIYASSAPEEVKSAQQALGREHSGALLERALSTLAVRLSEQGFSQIIVAGGETSGAVVQKLNPGHLLIGPEICPGVPWTATPTHNLALKSGNFGSRTFFEDAWEAL
ncbi:3-oxo-tetronate kinase [Deinococcus cellulosilyticus]|uniref:3-oxo-tetronate kinase n=1 Tax=Deinococcus cellulosilyticus (strain DSM 18568 / NBRC 106333 / KACC 11606 / 5516J-15) TaxID=1223518 RepID=A0A511N488_DEIC1|nr:3-oxo-tetronate kinase [Deinococcus cellulosilyticus]GEM47236.1 HPr kinase [Deinococcus cellulosilyticus NBRC 106333 = KACC 11606]